MQRVLVLCIAWCAAWPSLATAAPVSGPREVVDYQFTTQRPGAPTGFEYAARYHAEGDPSGDPPYMRRMVTYNPAGLRLDTSVPEACTATDTELALRGPDACPPGSRLGEGKAEGKFLGFPSTLTLEMFNNVGEQILVARTPGWATVARGKLHPDGSLEYASPTCYPAVSPPGCPADTALQLGSQMTVPPYVNAKGSYATTPATCPRSGHWETPIAFWWADDSADTVVTRQPCAGRRQAARTSTTMASTKSPKKNRPTTSGRWDAQ